MNRRTFLKSLVASAVVLALPKQFEEPILNGERGDMPALEGSCHASVTDANRDSLAKEIIGWKFDNSAAILNQDWIKYQA